MPFQLGWDPTITRVQVAPPVQPAILSPPTAAPVGAVVAKSKATERPTPVYDIQVRAEDGEVRTYRTRRLLSAFKAEGLRGRGTRVWACIEIRDGEEVGEEVVLKDTWRDTTRVPEGVLHTRIRQDAEGKPQTLEALDDLMLPVEL